MPTFHSAKHSKLYISFYLLAITINAWWQLMHLIWNIVKNSNTMSAMTTGYDCFHYLFFHHFFFFSLFSVLSSSSVYLIPKNIFYSLRNYFSISISSNFLIFNFNQYIIFTLFISELIWLHCTLTKVTVTHF